MKKVLFGVVALAIVIVGINYAQGVVASRDNSSADEAAVIQSNIRIQQRNLRTDSKKARALRQDKTAMKVSTTTASTSPRR